MDIPFYIVIIPALFIFFGGLWAIYLRISHDPECHLEKKMKSDLQEARELDPDEHKEQAESGV